MFKQEKLRYEMLLRVRDFGGKHSAHAFIAEGEAASHRWVPLGLPETSIADLRTATEAFAQAISGRREGKTGLTAARVALREALTRGFDAVRELDVIVANTPQLDPVVLAVWERSRRVNPKSTVDADDVATPPVVPVTVVTTPAEGKSAARETESVDEPELVGVAS